MIVLIALLFAYSSEAQLSHVLDDTLYQDLVNVNIEMHHFFDSKDSLAQSKITYHMAKIVAMRDRFILRQHLYNDYRNDNRMTLEIYDITSRDKYSSHVVSYVYYGRQLVIYYADPSQDIYTKICTACSVDPQLFDTDKDFVLHTTVDSSGVVTVSEFIN